MPVKDDNLLFLENKINEIKVAIFKAEVDEGPKIPHNIVSTVKTDSNGNIWFFTSYVGETIKNNNEFFAYLDYYHKGQDCRLRLSGKASIVEGDNEFGNYKLAADPTTMNIALIKYKILYAEYFENKSDTVSLAEKLKNFFSDIFVPNSPRVYDFT